MNTLRDRTILAMVADVTQRESVVWSAWTIAVASGARIHVTGQERAADSAAIAWRTGTGASIAPQAGTCLEAARRFSKVEARRWHVPEGTELAMAQCSTIRLKPMKIGAVVLRNSRRVSGGSLPGFMKHPG